MEFVSDGAIRDYNEMDDDDEFLDRVVETPTYFHWSLHYARQSRNWQVLCSHSKFSNHGVAASRCEFAALDNTASKFVWRLIF